MARVEKTALTRALCFGLGSEDNRVRRLPDSSPVRQVVTSASFALIERFDQFLNE